MVSVRGSPCNYPLINCPLSLQAIDYINILNDVFQDRMFSPVSEGTPFGHFTYSRVQIPTGSSYGVSIPTLNPDDDNSVVNLVYQVGVI